jgi:hypothetical protein
LTVLGFVQDPADVDVLARLNAAPPFNKVDVLTHLEAASLVDLLAHLEAALNQVEAGSASS